MHRCYKLQPLAAQAYAKKRLHVGHPPLFTCNHKRQGKPRGARSARAANAVNIVFGRLRYIKVDNRGKLGNVKAAGSYVGGNQDNNLVVFESFQGCKPLALRLIPVNGIGCDAFANQLAGKPACANFGVGKDNNLCQFFFPYQVNNRLTLQLGGIDAVEPLGKVFGRCIAPCHFNRNRLLV